MNDCTVKTNITEFDFSACSVIFSPVEFPFSTFIKTTEMPPRPPPPQASSPWTRCVHKHVQTCVDRQTKVSHSMFPPFTSLGAFGRSGPSHPVSRHDFEWPPPVPSAFLFQRALAFFPRVYKITLETLTLYCSQSPQGVWGKQKRQLTQGQTHIPTSPKGGQRQGSIMFMATLVQSDWLGNHGIWTVCLSVGGGWVFICMWEYCLCIYIMHCTFVLCICTLFIVNDLSGASFSNSLLEHSLAVR